MAVRQLPKEKATKDGRRWCFYDRIKVNGLTKLYVSKNYMNKAEAIKAERDFFRTEAVRLNGLCKQMSAKINQFITTS